MKVLNILFLLIIDIYYNNIHVDYMKQYQWLILTPIFSSYVVFFFY